MPPEGLSILFCLIYPKRKKYVGFMPPEGLSTKFNIPKKEIIRNTVKNLCSTGISRQGVNILQFMLMT
jgi:hypothetical protein